MKNPSKSAFRKGDFPKNHLFGQSGVFTMPYIASILLYKLRILYYSGNEIFFLKSALCEADRLKIKKIIP